MKKPVLWIAAFAMLAGTLHAQEPTEDSQVTVRSMAKDADPGWDVVSVKARSPSEINNNESMRMRGSQLVIENKTVQTMMLLGYGVHKKQIVGAPDWITTERWDVRGVPDVPGRPNLKQMQSLVRRVLEERFGLKLHRESKELAVYAITVAKGGAKIAPSTSDPNDPPNENDNGSNGQVTIKVTNMSMSEFPLVLGFWMDRPAVDQTGLVGRYDFQLKWTSDESRTPADGSAPPGLFTAIQEQIGLKLEPAKVPVDVLVIDHVERPSAN